MSLLKLNNDKIVVGYDLGNVYSQISYGYVDSDEVETISTVAGTESFNIPTVLAKRKQVNQWFYGREALHYSENDVILIDNLLELAIDGEKLLIEGVSYDPTALLALFIKRSLALLSSVIPVNKIGNFILTCDKLDGEILKMLETAIASSNIKASRIAFQSHMESYFYYMIHQPQELWQHESLLLFYDRDTITSYRMETNNRTTPIVAFVETEVFTLPYLMEGEEEETYNGELMDRRFLDIVNSACSSRIISSVYLIGENFSEKWMKESLKALCRNRRVFQGNNLFSKGACYGMRERLEVSEIGSQYVFLGNDKLKANIGMKVMRRGQESYFALLDAGINWYEAKNTVEFYLQDSGNLEIIITPLMGSKAKVFAVDLGELKGGIKRIKMQLYFEEENKLSIEIEDLGLGELIPSTFGTRKEEVAIY